MTTNIALLPVVTVAAVSSQDGDCVLSIAFQAGGVPIDASGIVFSMVWRSSKGGVQAFLPPSSGAGIANGGASGLVTFAAPEPAMARLPVGVYLGSLVAVADGQIYDLGVWTLTHSAIGGCLVTSIATTPRNTASASSVGYIPGPGWNQWKGTWSSSTAYKVNDVVAYAFSSWIALDANTNQTPASGSSHWNVVASGIDPAVAATVASLSSAVATLQSALASLTSASLTDATAAGRAMLQAASAAAQKALLSLTSSDLTDSTAAGRALLTAATVAAQLTALGAGTANGPAQLDATGKVPTSQLPSSVLGDVQYQSGWNASTNTPAIPAASAANKGWYYIVTTAGTTSISGCTDWQVGDWLVSNGAAWDKLDNTDLVLSVAGKVGAVTLQAADLTDSTAAGRAVLTAASAAAGRTALAAAASGANTDISSLGGVSGGGVDLNEPESTIASAATTDIGAVNTLRAAINGTTAITSFGTATNRIRFLRFAGVLTLTHNATSLILPTGANITTQAGDTATAVSDGAGNWRMTQYLRADGSPLVAAASPGAVRYDTSQSGLTAAQRQQAMTNIGAINGGLVNKLRNGTMDIWQRGYASMSVPTVGAYTADGWFVLPAGAAVTVAQAAGRLFTVNSMKITGAASVTDVQVKQPIESYLAAPLSGQACTVQAWVYNGTGASITPTLTIKHPGAQDNYASSPVTDVNAVALQSCASGAWTRVAYAFTAPATINGLEVIIDFGALGSGAYVQMAEADLRASPSESVGLIAAPQTPELRSISVELPLCQRYFSASYGNGVAPGTATAAGLVSGGTGFYAGGVYTYAGTISYPVQMRATPTLKYWDGAGTLNATASASNGTVTNGGGALTFSSTSPSGFLANNAGYNFSCHYNAASEIAP